MHLAPPKILTNKEETRIVLVIRHQNVQKTTLDWVQLKSRKLNLQACSKVNLKVIYWMIKSSNNNKSIIRFSVRGWLEELGAPDITPSDLVRIPRKVSILVNQESLG